MKISGLAAGGAPQVGDLLAMARAGSSLSVQAGSQILAVANLAAQGFAVFNSAAAVTLLAAGHAAGTFRISAYLVITTTFVTNTTVNLNIGFTDDATAQVPSPVILTTSTLTANTAIQTSYTFRSTGAAAITYTPGKTGSAASAGVASFSVVLERLI